MLRLVSATTARAIPNVIKTAMTTLRIARVSLRSWYFSERAVMGLIDRPGLDRAPRRTGSASARRCLDCASLPSGGDLGRGGLATALGGEDGGCPGDATGGGGELMPCSGSAVERSRLGRRGRGLGSLTTGAVISSRQPGQGARTPASSAATSNNIPQVGQLKRIEGLGG